MPEWIIDLLNNPIAVTAIGAAIIGPFLKFLADIFMKASPPPGPIAHDIRSLPDHPLLVSAKVHLADEEMAMLTETTKTVRRIEQDLRRAHERIDLMMRR